MQATDRATTQFAELLTRSSQRQARRMVECFDHYTRQIDALKAGEGKGNAGGVAWGLLSAMDVAIAESLKRDPQAPRIACKPGCAGCCRIEVRVTAGEAALLLHAARELGVTPDPARLAAQAAAPDFQALPPDLRTCAFLGEDGRCQVYEYRPGACRKYFALDNPDDCDTVNNNGARVLNLVAAEAEAIASAMISREESGRMATMLEKVAAQ